MNRSSLINEYNRKKNQNLREIELLRLKKKELMLQVQDLDIKKKLGELDLYKHQYELQKLLQNRSLWEWEHYINASIKHYQAEIRRYDLLIDNEPKPITWNRTGIALILLLMFGLSILFMNQNNFTGFTILGNETNESIEENSLVNITEQINETIIDEPLHNITKVNETIINETIIEPLNNITNITETKEPKDKEIKDKEIEKNETELEINITEQVDLNNLTWPELILGLEKIEKTILKDYNNYALKPDKQKSGPLKTSNKEMYGFNYDDYVSSNKTRTRTMYFGLRNVPYNGSWYRIENAPSLKEIVAPVIIKTDPALERNYEITVIDYNLTSELIRIKPKTNDALNKVVPYGVKKEFEVTTKRDVTEKDTGRIYVDRTVTRKTLTLPLQNITFTSLNQEKIFTVNAGNILSNTFSFGENSIEHIYNFSNVSVGFAYEKGGAIPTNPYDYNFSALSNDYTSLAVSDDNRWATNLIAASYEHESQIFLFNVSEDISSLNNIAILWEGYGENNTGYYTNLSAYNWSSNQWINLDAKDFTDSTDANLNKTLSSAFNNFIVNTTLALKVTMTNAFVPNGQISEVGMYRKDGFLPGSIHGADYIQVYRDVAYIVANTSDSFVAINISDPTNPVLLGNYSDDAGAGSLDGAFATKRHPTNIDVFIVTSETDDYITVLNVSNKSNIVVIGSGFTDSAPLCSIDGARGFDFMVRGSEVDLVVASNIDDGITILNITNLASITCLGSITNATTPNSLDGATFVDVVENRAYVTAYVDDSLTIINLSNPALPVPLGDHVDSAAAGSVDGAWQVEIIDKVAYVTSDVDDYFTPVNISDSENPVALGNGFTDAAGANSIDQPRGFDMIQTLDGRIFAFITSYIDDGINMLNVSDPANPVSLGAGLYSAAPDNRYDSAAEVYRYGDYVYMVSQFNNSLAVLQVNNPSILNTDYIQINVTYTIPDLTNPLWIAGSVNVNATQTRQNQLINFTTNWTDNVRLDSWIFENNQSGTFINSTSRAFATGVNISSNVTMITAIPGTNVTWRFWVNDSSNNWNYSMNTFVVSDGISPLWIAGSVRINQSNVYPNHRINFTTNWTDDVDLDSWIFENNQSGTFINSTSIAFATGVNISSNVTMITAGSGLGVTWRFWVNDSSGNWNYSEDSFVVADDVPPQYVVGSIQTNETMIHPNDRINFTTNWTDNVRLDSWIFENNQSGTFINSTSRAFATGVKNGISSNITLVNAVSGTSVTWRFWVNDSSNNWNYSEGSFVIADDIPPQYVVGSSIINDTQVIQNQLVNFTANWTDNVRLDSWIFENDQGGVFFNSTSRAFATGLNMSTNITRITAAAGTTIQWRFWANDSNGNWGSTALENIIVADTTPPQWIAGSIIKNETNIYQNMNVEFKSNWTDDVKVADYIFSINQTGLYVNSSISTLDEPENVTINVTKITALTGTNVSWVFWASDTSGNWNVTSVQSFIVADNIPPQYIADSIAKNQTIISQGTKINFTANWTDNHNLSTFIFSIKQDSNWVNSTALPFALGKNISSNVTMITAPPDFNVSWMFWVNDSSNNWNNTGEQSFFVSCLYNGTANWIVNTTCELNQIAFQLNGNLTINSPGNLSLRNVNITVNNTNYAKYLTVNSNGILELLDLDNDNNTMQDRTKMIGLVGNTPATCTGTIGVDCTQYVSDPLCNGLSTNVCTYSEFDGFCSNVYGACSSISSQGICEENLCTWQAGSSTPGHGLTAHRDSKLIIKNSFLEYFGFNSAGGLGKNGLDLNGTSVIINSTFTSTNAIAVYHNNIAFDGNIINNSLGYVSLIGIENITIRNNYFNVTSSGGPAILLQNTSNINITHNIFLSNASTFTGIKTIDSLRITIFDNIVNSLSASLNQPGIYLLRTNNSNVSYNNVNEKSTNLLIWDSYNNLIENINLSGASSAESLYLINSSLNNINNVNINTSTTGNGIYIIQSHNNSFKNFNIEHKRNAMTFDLASDNKLDNIFVRSYNAGTNSTRFITNSFNNKIFNSVLNSTGRDLTTLSGYNYFINTSFNQSSNYAVGSSIVNVQWYLDVNVSYYNGSAAAGTNVTLFNRTNVYYFSDLAGSNGLVARKNVTEYVYNGTGKIFYTNYTVTANTSASGIANFNGPMNITSNMQYNITLQQSADINPPQWVAGSVNVNQTYVYQNDFINFTTNWTDESLLSSWIFENNQSGTFVNSTSKLFSNGVNISSNVTKITGAIGTNVTWRFWVNDSSNNLNYSVNTFVIGDHAVCGVPCYGCTSNNILATACATPNRICDGTNTVENITISNYTVSAGNQLNVSVDYQCYNSNPTTDNLAIWYYNGTGWRLIKHWDRSILDGCDTTNDGYDGTVSWLFTPDSNLGVHYVRAIEADPVNASTSECPDITYGNIDDKDFLVIPNNVPRILSVSSIASQTVTEGGANNITFSFLADDQDGVSNLNVSSAYGTFNLSGYSNQRINQCTKVGDINATAANFTCSIDIWYFDNAGAWSNYVNITDNQGTGSLNSTWTLQSTTSISFTPQSLTWSTIMPGTINQTSINDPILINNIGNTVISDGNIRITAINLIGINDQSKYIPAANFSVFNNTGSNLECAPNSAVVLSNNSLVGITGVGLLTGNNTAGQGQQNLYFCLYDVPKQSALPAQTYSTNGSGSWTISVI